MSDKQTTHVKRIHNQPEGSYVMEALLHDETKKKLDTLSKAARAVVKTYFDNSPPGIDRNDIMYALDDAIPDER